MPPFAPPHPAALSVTAGPGPSLTGGRLAPRPEWRFALYAAGVVVVAVALRAVGIATWSLWEDEEGSLTRAHEDIFWGFQKYFPVFFYVLRKYVDLVGLSVGPLRALPAVAGVLSILFTMTGFRRHVSGGTAAVAGLLLAVNLGHLFFSQSVRYYTTVLALEVLALAWFFDGFESARPEKLALSLAALVVALFTHFSALLTIPALLGYLAAARAAGERRGGYRLTWCAAYAAAAGLIAAFFSWRMVLLQREMIGGMAIPSQRDPVHVATTVAAYFGLPLLALGAAAPLLARSLPRRTLLFLTAVAVIPVAELLVLAGLNAVNVTWYYGLVAMPGFALLAAATLTGPWVRGRRGAAVALAAIAFGYYLAHLGVYYTTAHGDRPRWAEAAEFLRRQTGLRPGNPDNPKVFATVPGTVGFYLGEHPSNPERFRVVKDLPKDPPEFPVADWYVVEVRVLPPKYQAWFAGRCAERARFEARTGPVDRTVVVYEYRPTPPRD